MTRWLRQWIAVYRMLRAWRADARRHPVAWSVDDTIKEWERRNRGAREGEGRAGQEGPPEEA